MNGSVSHIRMAWLFDYWIAVLVPSRTAEMQMCGFDSEKLLFLYRIMGSVHVIQHLHVFKMPR